jgi:hypothetical protein
MWKAKGSLETKGLDADKQRKGGKMMKCKWERKEQREKEDDGRNRELMTEKAVRMKSKNEEWKAERKNSTREVRKRQKVRSVMITDIHRPIQI